LHDVVIQGGLVFDGTGAPAVEADVAIADGRVTAIGADVGPGRETIEARGRWVTPGFVDNHTHYDAELLLAPGLPESVRHGVTTVCIGSCSLSTIFCGPTDCADLFARVEAVPYDHVIRALQGKGWSDPAGYRRHLESLPLGPNVMAFVGHSDLRTSVMGLEAATSSQAPTEEQLTQMERRVQEGLDAGFLGLSGMTNPWDKVGGDRARSRPLPSTYARRAEWRRLTGLLRAHGAIFQTAPNITTKVGAALHFWDSSPLFGLRKPLKTTMITVADTKADPWLSRLLLRLSSAWDALMGGDIRWQGVPMPFEVYADGIDLVVFEEFGAGEEALHLTDQVERNELFADPAYRRRFRKDYDKRYGARVWQRDFHDAHIVCAPDPSLAGRTIGEVADARGEHPVDTFLDLVVAHGKALRWRTTIANHRPDRVREIIAHPMVHPGFADSGAHLRNMAFYNFPLHVLRMARLEDAPFDAARAVHRVTGEMADWYGVDVGKLAVGAVADVAVVDPEALDDRLDEIHEAPVEVFGGLSRMVRRNDDAVRATLVGGRVVWKEGAFAEGFGESFGTGRFLAAGEAARVLAMASK